MVLSTLDQVDSPLAARVRPPSSVTTLRHLLCTLPCDWDDRWPREALVGALVNDAVLALEALDGQVTAATASPGVELPRPGSWPGRRTRARTRTSRSVRKVAKDRVISTVDPEGGLGHKSRTRHFDGYRALLSSIGASCSIRCGERPSRSTPRTGWRRLTGGGWPPATRWHSRSPQPDRCAMWADERLHPAASRLPVVRDCGRGPPPSPPHRELMLHRALRGAGCPGLARLALAWPRPTSSRWPVPAIPPWGRSAAGSSGSASRQPRGDR